LTRDKPDQRYPRQRQVGRVHPETDPALAERLLVEPEAYLELVKRVNTSAERTDDLISGAL